jgi:tol-pal system protein YbgF
MALGKFMGRAASNRFAGKNPLMALAAGVLLGAALASGSAWAQAASSDVRVLIERMERLENDLRGLQRQVFRPGQPVPPGAITPPPPPPPEAPSIAGGIANALSARLDEIESQVRQLTGRVEETDHGISVLKQRIEKLVADVDFRLTALERAGAQAQAPVAAASPPPAPPPTAGAPTPPQGRLPPGVLGTLPATAAVAARPGKLPEGSPQSQYNFAFGLLRQNDYVAAEQAFGEFLSLYPSDALASNAQYWLGESYFARKEYDRAAQAFLAGYQKYPKGSKAPDSLLKLAMSLSNLEQKQEACAAFKQLDKDFPSAPPSLQRLSVAERARAGCR